MEWTLYRLLLACVMFISGTLCTVLNKWADREVAMGTAGYPPRHFNHPFFQAIVMFLSELLCGLAFCIILLRHKSPKSVLGNMTFNLKEIFTQEGSFPKSFFVFFPPAMCDLVASSVMYMALNYTTAASYQMLRGSVVIFTALLSVAFLKRTLNLGRWIGILAVVGGLVIVGLADYLFNSTSMDVNSVITGDELVVFSQAVQSLQLVWEERFLTKLDVHPLLAVGLEGVYGFIVLILLSIPMYFISVGPQFSNSPEYRLEDMLDALAQMANNWHIAVAMAALLICFSFFNWSSVSVTKKLSATTRVVIDSCRTLAVWGVTLGLGWQTFQWLQIVGFAVLTVGIFLYNQILPLPLMKEDVTCKCCSKSFDKSNSDFTVKPPIGNPSSNDEADF